MASKTTGTVSKQLYVQPLLHQRAVDAFPLREPGPLQYLPHLNQEPTTAASAGRSFVEAVRCARGVLGLHGDVYGLGTQGLNGLAIEVATKEGPHLASVVADGGTG